MFHNFYSMTTPGKHLRFCFRDVDFPKTHPKTKAGFFQVEGDEFVKRQPPKAVGSTPEKNEGGDLGNPGSTKIYHGKWPKPWGI